MADEDKQKRMNKKVKANATAAGEWFKSAAWLQVLLIVAVVIGVVVSIPYIVQCAKNNSESSTFFTSHQISYDELNKDLSGKNTKNNGVVGYGTDSWSVSGSSTDTTADADKIDGFLVMYYKENNESCTSMQQYLENAYSQINKASDIQGKLKFFTVNCTWTPGDDDAASNEGNLSLYDNTDISLDQQQAVMEGMKTTYLAQDKNHQVTTVTATTLSEDLKGTDSNHTVPTPAFVLYTKKKSETSYPKQSEGDKVENYKPTKVIFSSVGSLATNSDSSVLDMMYDLFNFKIYSK
ncbi:MAG: hypothetical protein WCR16_01155 [Bacilli bacterium]